MSKEGVPSNRGASQTALGGAHKHPASLNNQQSLQAWTIWTSFLLLLQVQTSTATHAGAHTISPSNTGEQSEVRDA
jgi:hypothetical protein